MAIAVAQSSNVGQGAPPSGVNAPSPALRLGVDLDVSQFIYDEAQTVEAIALMAWPQDVHANPAAVFERARTTLEKWIALGLPSLIRDGRRRFDIGCVINFMRGEGLAGRDATFLESVVPAHRRMVERSMTLRPGFEPGLHSPRRYRVELRRDFHLLGEPGGKAIRLRLPAPYPDPTQRDIEQSVTPPAGGIVAPNLPGRVEVRMPSSAVNTTVSVQAMFAFTAFETSGGFHDFEGARLPEDQRELYLRPGEGLIRVTPWIRQLAEELAGPLDHIPSTLKAFWDYFLYRLHIGYVRHYELDSADPLRDLVRRGWLDCLGASSLFVALCRARDIPARVVRGIYLHKEAPDSHYWAEVYVDADGWRPVDVSSLANPMPHGRPVSGSEADPYAYLFLGRLEHRMKMEVYPRCVVGMMGLKFPDRWSMVAVPATKGSRTTYYDTQSSKPVYSDTVAVTLLSEHPISSKA